MDDVGGIVLEHIRTDPARWRSVNSMLPRTMQKFWTLVLLVDFPAYMAVHSSSHRRRASGGISAAEEAAGYTSATRTAFQLHEKTPWKKKSSSTSSGVEGRGWGREEETCEKVQEEENNVSFFSDVHEEGEKRKNKQEGGKERHTQEKRGMSAEWELQQWQRQVGKRQEELLEEERFSIFLQLLDCLLLELLRAYGPSLLALDPAGEAPDMEFHQAVLAAEHYLQQQQRRSQKQEQPISDQKERISEAATGGIDVFTSGTPPSHKGKYKEQVEILFEKEEELQKQQSQQRDADWVKRRRRCDEKNVREHLQGSWGSAVQSQRSEEKEKRVEERTGMETQTEETQALSEENKKKSLRHTERMSASAVGHFVDMNAAVHLVMNAYVQEQEEFLGEQEQCSGFLQ